ncbi:MAG: restriction endonuclease subunit M [Desulfuromonas sp.]|nr:MAG: restriction endonuclease subunit M [Desulfuromonas sp.]
MKHHPVIPWIGGKRRLAKEILPLIPKHTCYVEPFCGAAAIFFLKSPSKAEVINDVHGELVNLYRVIQHHLEEFCRQFKHALVSRQLFTWLQQTPPEVLTDIQRAARFYYLQKMSFGGKVKGQTFGTSATSPPRLNLLRLEEDLSQAHLRLSRVTIEHLDWQSCVAKYDRPVSLFFCDPPYWQTEGYGVDFPLEQYHALAEAMRTMQGKTILTVNDHSEMRKAFAGLTMKSVGIDYTVGGNHKRVARRELIVRNWGE